jgi:hypothetical protein
MPAIKKDTDNKIADQKEVTKLEVSATKCPRCSASFVCNAANIQQCQCWGVVQTGCLCRNCLLEIQREAVDAVNNSSLT